MTPTYNFTDDGTTATMNIACQAALNIATPADVFDAAAEATGNFQLFGYGSDVFTFSLPVDVSASYSCSALPSSVFSTGSMQFGKSSGTNYVTDASVFSQSFSTPSPTTSPLVGSGVLAPDVQYGFAEHWNVFQNQNNPVPTTASDDITLTFAAIPEPSSFCIMGLACAGLLGRRRSLGLPVCPSAIGRM